MPDCMRTSLESLLRACDVCMLSVPVLATQRLSLPGQQRTLHLQYVQLYNGVLSDLLDPETRYMRCAFLVCAHAREKYLRIALWSAKK